VGSYSNRNCGTLAGCRSGSHIPRKGGAMNWLYQIQGWIIDGFYWWMYW